MPAPIASSVTWASCLGCKGVLRPDQGQSETGWLRGVQDRKRSVRAHTLHPATPQEHSKMKEGVLKVRSSPLSELSASATAPDRRRKLRAVGKAQQQQHEQRHPERRSSEGRFNVRSPRVCRGRCPCATTKETL